MVDDNAKAIASWPTCVFTRDDSVTRGTAQIKCDGKLLYTLSIGSDILGQDRFDEMVIHPDDYAGMAIFIEALNSALLT